MNDMKKSAIAACALLVAACDKPPVVVGDAIDGPYYLSAAILSSGGGKMICYLKKSGACEMRVPPSVKSVGVNADFISAGVASAGAPDKMIYYYIVRDFDGPQADLARAVRGPYDEKGFLEQRRKHGVPGVERIVDL